MLNKVTQYTIGSHTKNYSSPRIIDLIFHNTINHIETAESFKEKFILSNFEQGDTRNSTSKRIFDLTFAVLLVILSAPLILILSLLIKLESRGPVIFSQERIGQFGKTITIYKLRSMYNTVSESVLNENNVKLIHHRVTRLGRILRKFRLDELPQLINIFKGEMSLIGPRPELPVKVLVYLAELPNYHKRLRVKPGISGLAQINQSYTESLQKVIAKLDYDLEYLEKMELFFDFIIALKTIKVVISGNGK